MKPVKSSHERVAFVIFGVTGDLTKRKLLPALYELSKEDRLPVRLEIIGFARRPWDDEHMREVLGNGIHQFARVKPVDQSVIDDLLTGSVYIQSDFHEEQGFDRLYQYLSQKGFKQVIYYLATPPDSYQTIIRNLAVCSDRALHQAQLRIVVEKPHGRDLESAQELEADLHLCFSEEQIFRIDHYLGKETVQNILVFRFANGIFEPLWNKNYIDHVQITVAESVGVGSRAGYFDNVGVVRDMFANHMLQLVTLTAMEAPYAFNAQSVRDEKMKVLRSLRPLKGDAAVENTLRAQYAQTVLNGDTLPGYLQEERVAEGSVTETYMAAKLFVDNWRWANVPFFIRSGKRMPLRKTEIAIQFKQVPLSLFNWENMAGEAPNVLVLRLQPDEGINLSFGAKKPGRENKIAPVTMEFCYQDAFETEPPEAYERLLLDVLTGDQTLFTRNDEMIEQWRFVTDILHAWQDQAIKTLPKYEIHTWGPPEADEFIESGHRKWRNSA